ncbi:MAG: Gfo/Idh/MocA family oxidoreductase, partial [Clostridia bacterium]|nr:Gfo/Idh/MocA family oxidoreductase [Clostridia bacterium]
MKNGKFQVGIIGTGWIAEAHAEAYNKMDDVEIVALADVIPGKTERFAKEWGIENARHYNSHLHLLDNEKELDAVSICTYNRQHAPCTIDALRRGVNVLLEKPMCVT